MTPQPISAEKFLELLAAETGRDPETIRSNAAAFDIEPPEEADWEPLEEDWEDSPAYREY